MPGSLAGLWTHFADTSCRGYSPLYDAVCRRVATSDEVLGLVAAAPPEARLPNVLLAAVHFMVLGGADDQLARVYCGEEPADPGRLFVEFCLSHRQEIGELLETRRTNTNEVGRSALIGPALTWVAARQPAPLGLVDVGCSAGLNLLCDRWLLDYGASGRTGPALSPVRLDCEVLGGEPPIAPVLPPLAGRIGLDRHPVDLADAEERRWQLALVWPDTGRLARTAAALEAAAAAAPEILAGDAVEDLEAAIDRLPGDCVAVVVTTWSLVYLPKDRRADFAVRVADISSGDRPVVWVSLEGRGVVPLLSGVEPPVDARGTVASVMGAVEYRAGIPTATLLGFCQPHGAWLDWRAVPSTPAVI